ncbi:hypothetical protein B9J80_04515 [Vibrio sp. V12_P9A6T4]|uniref:hypothetical protein n=1 Tax=Vibrio sp. V12_P9A6T4 TaxID=1938667 RepID=UPI000B8E9896|nr:hypothetical protein [Vibrio sp. V12_P9A6T4]OXX56169.1 hypothetical protein B9J80_04515 [Vibrio sp. V12_P9A6T4]
MFLEQLTRPFVYLRIKGMEGKNRYDWHIPIVFTLLTLALAYLSSTELKIVNTVLLDPITSFTANLPGFYIAALAAIAAFQNPMLSSDMVSAGPKTPYILTPYLDENYQKKVKEQSLKRRTYLTHMFAFLTAESFVLVILNKLSVFFESNLSLAIYATIFLVIFWQLVVTTFCGLYYLGERLHD